MDFDVLVASEVPTYFKVISDVNSLNKGRLLIQYWFYYGWQPPCNILHEWDPGAHHGDWENIIVCTNPDRTDIDAVVYAQHAGWYTRLPGGFETTESGRPIVFVGLTAHGSFHKSHDLPWPEAWLTPTFLCRYFNDFRAPNDDTWWDTSSNLVSLRSKSELWMLAEPNTMKIAGKTYGIDPGWRWGQTIRYCKVFTLGICLVSDTKNACGTHPSTRALSWSMSDCEDSGCDRSQGPGWPVPAVAPGPAVAAEAAQQVVDVAAGYEPKPEELDRLVEALNKALAVTLGMRIEDAKAANEEGLTIFHLAKNLCVDLNEVWPATQKLRDEVLEKAAQDGSLTRQQADYLKKLLARFDPASPDMGAGRAHITDKAGGAFRAASPCKPCGQK